MKLYDIDVLDVRLLSIVSSIVEPHPMFKDLDF